MIFSSIAAYAQDSTKMDYTPLAKETFQSYKTVNYLYVDTSIKKIKGKIKIPYTTQYISSYVILDEDSPYSEIEFKDGAIVEYKKHRMIDYIGEVNGTPFYLVSYETDGVKTFDLRSHHSPSSATLIGMPVFSQDMKCFVCVDDSKTFVQFGFVEDDFPTTNSIPILYPDRIGAIKCAGEYKFISEDKEKHYWQIEISNK